MCGIEIVRGASLPLWAEEQFSPAAGRACDGERIASVLKGSETLGSKVIRFRV